MDNRQDMNYQELLREISAEQRRNGNRSRITTVAVVLLTTAMIIGLAILIPTLLRTLREVHTTMENTQAFLLRANTALDGLDDVVQKLDGMVENLDNMAKDMDGMVGSAAESLRGVAEMFGGIDTEKLTGAIQSLNSVIEPLTRLFGG
jgi:hypothetical protein